MSEWEEQRIVEKQQLVGFLSEPLVSAGQQPPPFHQTQILDFRTNLLRVPNIAIIVHPFSSILFVCENQKIYQNLKN